MCKGCAISMQCVLGVCLCVSHVSRVSCVCNGCVMDVQWVSSGCAMGVQGTECVQCVVGVWCVYVSYVSRASWVCNGRAKAWWESEGVSHACGGCVMDVQWAC